MVQTIFAISIDPSNGIKAIAWLREEAKTTEKQYKKLEKASKKRLRNIISSARMAWGMVQGMVRAAGGSISMTTRLAVSAGFGAVQALQPVLFAAFHGGIATMNTAAITASLMGLAELTSALSALAAFESGQKDLSLRLRGLNFTMSNMSMMLSSTSI